MKKLILIFCGYLLGIQAHASSYSYPAGSVRNDYSSVTVTTVGYRTLVSSLTLPVTHVEVFDSSGQTLKLAIGSDCSHLVDQFLIFPGGNGDKDLSAAAGSCVAEKAVSGNATQGEIDLNFFN